MAEPDSAALATRDAMSGLSAFAWIEATPDGLVAFLLLAPAVLDVCSADMVGLADAIGLVPPTVTLADVGPRVVVQPTTITVELPEVCRALRITVTDEWAQFVSSGGTVVLLVGADQLSPDSGRAEVEAYMRARLTTAGQLWLGKTCRRYSAQQLEGAACFECGTTEPPLHPSSTVELPDGPDIVRVYETVLCTRHLVVTR